MDAGGDANGTDAVVGAPVHTNEWGGVFGQNAQKLRACRLRCVMRTIGPHLTLCVQAITGG
jgi:hypothetical protein